METDQNLTGLIAHGESIIFKCKDSRILTATLYPTDTFSVKCDNGEMKRDGTWPEKENVSFFKGCRWISDRN